MKNLDDLSIDAIRDHINSAKRVDLQALYKQCGIKGANKKNEVLRETLIQFYEVRVREREEEDEMEGDTGSTAGEMSVDTDDDGPIETVEDVASMEVEPSTSTSEGAQLDLERSAIDMQPSNLGASFSPQRTPFPSPERDLPTAAVPELNLLEDLQDQVSGLRRDLETSRKKTVVVGTPSIRLTVPSDDDEQGTPTSRRSAIAGPVTPLAETEEARGEQLDINADIENYAVQTPNVVSKTFAFFSQGWGYKPSSSPTPSKIPLPDSPLGSSDDDDSTAVSGPETPVASIKAVPYPTPAVTPASNTGPTATLAVLGVRTIPNPNNRATSDVKKANLPRRLSLMSNSSSCPAKPLVSPVDSRTSSSSSSALSCSQGETQSKLTSSGEIGSSEGVPTGASMEQMQEPQEYGIAQLAAMTPFTKGRLQYPITLPRAALPAGAGQAEQKAQIGSSNDTPARPAASTAGAKTCINLNIRRVAGLERGMASLNLLDQSPSPCRGNFLRLTPEVEHV